jgi:hypothetical protein
MKLDYSIFLDKNINQFDILPNNFGIFTKLISCGVNGIYLTARRDFYLVGFHVSSGVISIFPNKYNDNNNICFIYKKIKHPEI